MDGDGFGANQASKKYWDHPGCDGGSGRVRRWRRLRSGTCTNTHSIRQPIAQPHANRIAQPIANTYSNAYRYTHCNANSNANCNANSDTYSDPDTDTDTYSNPDPHGCRAQL
jgi:hypothetical protein